MNRRAEWRGKADLAEYAEALGIETKLIMAVQPSDPTIVVYTPELDESNLDDPGPIMFASLARDADGILVVMGEPSVSSMDWQTMKRNIEAEIERRLDDGA
jgi:hypothetical protein